MSEKMKEMLDDFAVTLEFSVRDLNVLLNALNMPNQTATTAFAYFVNVIQNQAGPQVQKAKTDLEAVIKSQEENKDE
jgi:hypothetical protein